MKLTLERVAKQPTYTIGRLYIEGSYFCDTLEDKDRGLSSKMSLKEIKSKKIKDETAIPVGEYEITLDVVSPRFGAKKQYEFCKGKLPRLIDVPGYDGVLIHIGNTDKDSSGCILVGRNKVKGQVIDSTATFMKLYEILSRAATSKEKIWIKVK